MSSTLRISSRMSLLVGKLEAVAGAVQVSFTQCDVSRLLSTHCPMKKRTMTTTKIIQKNNSNVSSSSNALSRIEGSHINTATVLIPSEIDAEGMEVVQPINAPDVTLLAHTLASTTDPSLPGHQIPVSSNNNNDHMNNNNNDNSSSNDNNNNSNDDNNNNNNNNNTNNDNKNNKKKKTKRGCRAGKLVKNRQTSSINGRQTKSKGPMGSMINVRPGMNTLPPPTSMLYAKHPHASSSSSTYTAAATVAMTTVRAPIYPPVVYPYHIPPSPSATSYPPAASSNSSSSSSSNIHNHNHAYHNRNSTTLYPPTATAQTPGLGGLGFPISNLPPQGPSINTNTNLNLNTKKRKRPSHPVSVSVGDRLVARIKANAALDSTIVWDKQRGKSSSSSQHQRQNDKLSDEKQLVVQPQQQRSHQDVLYANLPSGGQGNRLTHNDEAEGRAFSGGIVRDTVTSLVGVAGAAQEAAEYSSSEDDDDQGQDENEPDENTRCYYSQEDWMYKRKKPQKTKASIPRLAVREGSRQDQRQSGQDQGQGQGQGENQSQEESQDQVQSDSQGYSQIQGVDQGQGHGQGQGEGQEMDQELGEVQGQGNDHANSHDMLGEPVEDDVIRHTDDDDAMTIEDPCHIITSQAATINTTLSSSSSSTSSRVSFVALDNRLIGSDTSSSSTGNITAAPPAPSEAPPVLLTDSSTVSTTGHGSSQSVYPPSETSSQWHRNVVEGDAIHDIYLINTPSQ